MQPRKVLPAFLASTVDLTTALVKRGAASYEDSFTAPQETGIVVDNYVIQGMSPAVTAAPEIPRYDLMARQNTFGRGPDTCAFFNDGLPLRCYSSDATCIYASPFAGCCESSSSCTSIPTMCIDYTDVLKGSCNPSIVTDPRTACCEREAPNCVLHSISLLRGTVGVWGCSTGQIGALLFTSNPAVDSEGSTTGSLTRSDATDDSGATPVAPGPKGTNTDDASGGDNDDGGSSTNVGAIAGGAVGGVAGLALIGAAIFFFMRHKKKEKATAGDASSPPMAQQHTASPGPQHDGAFGYNNVQPGYNQQQQYGHYDPKACPQQQQGSPGPYSPSAYSPGYGQQQQPAWGGYSSPTETHTSPAPVSTASPAATNNETTATELPDGRPTGSSENRAELG